MKSKLLLATIVLGAAAPASAHARTDDVTVTYQCSDLVVIGRFQNLEYEHVDLEDDILGHGWVTARVTVRRVLAGRPEARVVPVRYFAHSYFRRDRDFMLVIQRAGTAGNLIRSAHMMTGGRRPRLARTCG